MKLHLPSGLRKALMACLAAVALPATLPSTLASVSGIAAMMFLFTSQRATADFGPADVSYSSKDYGNDASIEGDTELLIREATQVDQNKLHVTGGSGANLKITAENTSGEQNYILDGDGFKTLKSIWLSQGNYEIYSNDEQYALDGTLQSLYVAGDNAHLTFKQYTSDAEGYFGGHKLAANFYIGRTTSTVGDDNVGKVFNLKLESGITVETSGSLTIQDTFGYICLANANGSKKAAKLAFDGSVSGSTLRLDSGMRNNSEAAGTLYLGTGGELTETLQLFDKATVVLGNGSTLKVGSFNSQWTSGTITTENNETATLEITKGAGTNVGLLSIGAGITLKMNATTDDGRQILAAANPQAENPSSLSGNLWIVRGTLELQDSDSDYTIDGNVQIDGGTLKFDKSTIVAGGIRYNVESNSAFSYNSGITVKGDWDIQKGGIETATTHMIFGEAIILDGNMTLSNNSGLQFGVAGGAASTVKGKITDAEGSYGQVWVENVGVNFDNDVELKGALRFGWGGLITLKTKVVVGSLLLDNGNHETTFAKAEDAEDEVYVVLKLSEEEGHESKLGRQDSGPTISDGTLTYEDNQFLGLFGSGVVFGVKGDGKTLVLVGGGTTAGGLSVGEGATMQLDGGSTGADFTVGGKISGAGTLRIVTGNDGRYLTLNAGGSIGSIEMSQWGGQLKIGADLTVGGMTEDAPVQINYNRKRSVDSSDETDRSFILNVAQGNHSVEKVQFGERINIVKRGNGKQTFREATVGGDVTVEAGELAFSATEGMTIGGAVSITGGTMSWSGGTLTITGQLSSSDGGTLSVAYGENTKLTLTGGVGEALSLTITGLTYEVANNGGWDLFGNSWNNEWKSKITVNGSVVNEGQRYKLKIDDSTHHIVLGDEIEVQSLTWTSSGAEDTLNWSGSSEWDENKTFEDYDGVTLAGGSTGGKVQLSKDVIAGSLTVTGSNNAVVSLLGTGTLNVDGELRVGSGATLSVGGNVTLQFGSVSASDSDGKLEVTAEGVIKPTAAATITSLNGAGGTIDLSSLSGEQEEGKTLTVTTLTFTSETTTTVSLGDSGILSTSGSVQGERADLIIDTGEQGKHGSGAIGLKMTGGGTLGSLQCKGLTSGAWVTAELDGEWNLEKESNLGNLQMNSGTNLKLTLGADFTLNGFGAVAWGSGGTKLEILAEEDGVDFVYDCQFSDKVVWFNKDSGSFVIGDTTHSVDFIVKHNEETKFTGFGVPVFSLTGNLEIQKGTLQFYSVGEGTIKGELSGAGTLSLTESNFTIGTVNGAGSIGTLEFRGSDGGATTTLKLVGDLTVKSVTKTHDSHNIDGQGILQRAGEAMAANVYLLIDTGAEVTEETINVFEERYAAVQTFGENTGVGKAGSGELKLSAVSGAEELTTPFKLAAGTLTWTGGTQKLGDFTAVSGTTLNVAGGNLQLGTFSGEITNLKLSGNGVLTAGVGVLTVGSIEVSGTDATLEIDAAGHAQIKLVSAGIFSSDGGILTIDVRNVSGAHYQLFDLGDSAPDWWTEWYGQYRQYVNIEADGVSDVASLNVDGSIDIMPSGGVTWVGGGDNNTWSNESDAEWRPNLQPDGQYVHFVKDTGGEKHEGTVRIEGSVTPRSVYIDGGTYTFVNAENGGGLDIAEGGMLQVSEGATLHLNLKNSSIPTVDLQGTLGLGHAEALPTNGTKLQFNRGVLLYDTEGVATDVSFLVDRENSTGDVRVRVEDAVGGVVWGSRNSAANSGVGLALDSGLDKSGTGNFTLAWKDDGKTEHGGKVTVEEGILTLDVAANSNAQLTGGVEVDGKGELALQVGSGSLSLSGDIGGDGKLSVSQGAVSLSGNNTIKQIELGDGTTTTISGNNALGGNDTTLILSGGTIAASSAAQVQAGKVTVNADTTLNGDITLTGNLEGSSSLTAAAGQSVSLGGDIAGYTGTLGTEEKSTWSLRGRAIGADGRLNVNLGGKGTFEVRGDSDVFLSGILGHAGDSFTLKNGGDGELIITSSNTDATGVSLDVGAGRIVLGDTEHAIDWKGQKISGEGELVLSNVTLGEGGFTSRGYQSKLRVETAVASTAGQAGVVDLNGMDVSNGALSGIVINERGQLKGVQGTITVGGNRGITVDIYLARENVGEGAMAAVVGSEEGVTFDVKRRNSLKLHIGASAAGAIAESFQDTEQAGTGTAILSVVENGSIGDSGADVSSYFDVSEEAQAVLDVTGAQVEKDEQGRIIITGSAADVYIVRDEMTLEGDGTGVLAESKATLLSRETSKLHLLQEGKDGTDDDITIRNLVGVSGSELTVENQAGDAENNRFTVHFDNTKADITQEDVKGEGKAEDVEGQDTTFYGSLTAGVGVDVEKEGLGTFTVGGNYTLKDGSTTITQGRLVLKGEKNSMEDLVFNYTGEPDPNGHQGDQPKAEERGLVLAGGGRTTISGTIKESTDKTGGGSDAIEIGDDSELVLTGNNTLEHATITADDAENGGGKLTIDGEGASLTLKGGDSQLSGVDVELKGEGSTLDVGDAGNDVASLSGNGVLKSAAGAELSVGGGSFSGTLDSSTGEAGKLVVEKDADFTLDNVTTGSDATKAWDVQVRDGGELTIDVSEKKSGESMTLGDVALGSGNTTTFKVNSDTYGATTVQGNSLTWGENSTILLEASAGETAWDPSKGELTLGSYGSIDGKVVDLDVQLRGDAFLMSDVTGVTEKDGKVVIELKETQDNKFERAIPGGEKNSMAGAQMFWGALKDKTQFETLIKVLSEPDSDYAKMVHGLVGLMDSGNKAELERALAAGAGSSISVLGPALVQDLHRQLGAIRNRTTTMANEVTYDSYDQLPMWHAWLNAEGNYHKMDSDGFAPGYTLNNWGGTVGADVDVSPATTVGVALTAMYGDLKPDASDAATGDLDTTYLSAFARTTKGAWIHTFVVSVGMADVSLNRTVNAGGASYRTQGSTDGYAVGAMYEVGYTKLMNRRGTVAFQPVFNVEIRHAAIKGYTETGSDAGLKVDDIEQDVVTFGFGARLQSIIGENIYNRTSILEGRLLVKADVGDNTGVAKNSLIGAATVGEVESAEVGALGIEAGIGLTIPLGASAGSVFMDASAEVRSGWTSFNATVGYRINF